LIQRDHFSCFPVFYILILAQSLVETFTQALNVRWR
jgi:hypothetical protein